MAIETKGFDEILKKFDNLDKKIKNDTAKSAIDKSANVMLEALKKEAPKAKKNSKNSASYLNKEVVKKSHTHQARMGINRNNWDKTKGLTKIAPIYSDVYMKTYLIHGNSF